MKAGSEAAFQTQVMQLAGFYGWRIDVASLVRRFEAKVDRSDPDGCWPWTGATTPDGYPRLRLSRRDGEVYAHRLVLEAAIGPIGAKHAHHKCVNPRCVKRDHLESLTVPAHADVHRPEACKRGHDLLTHASWRSDGRVAYCRACRRDARLRMSPERLENERAKGRPRAAAAYERKRNAASGS